MNMNDYPAGPHRFEGSTSEQRIAELEKELYLVRADAKQAMFEAEKAMAQIREATEKVVAERDAAKETLQAIQETAMEFYTKNGITESLNAKHPALVVRQAAAEILRLKAELAKVKADLETERMRLVACGVVALCDTPSSAKSAREMHQDYRSASLSDVERRVDECIQLRTKHDAAVAELVRLKDIFRVNMLRAFPDKSHAEIDAAIDAAKETK